MLSSLFYRGSIEVMNDLSWMYRVSPQWLQRMNYCNGVQGFINFATSIPRNFSGGSIRCSCRKCKNKKYMCWYAYRELFVRNESMVERMVGSTSSASNVHGVVNDNSNPYMNIEWARSIIEWARSILPE
jgi:hypothetical protein